MDIHIHPFRIKIDKQRRHGMSVAREEVLIGCADDAVQHAVLHRPSVHEQELQPGIAAVERRQAGKACDGHAIAFGVDLDGIFAKLAAHDRAQPGKACLRGIAGLCGMAEDRAAIAFQRKADIGARHGQPLDRIAHGQGLGALGFHEFQARRRCEKDIAHLDPRAAVAPSGPGRGLGPLDPPTFDEDFRRFAARCP